MITENLRRVISQLEELKSYPVEVAQTFAASLATQHNQKEDREVYLRENYRPNSSRRIGQVVFRVTPQEVERVLRQELGRKPTRREIKEVLDSFREIDVEDILTDVVQETVQQLEI